MNKNKTKSSHLKLEMDFIILQTAHINKKGIQSSLCACPHETIGKSKEEESVGKKALCKHRHN